MVTPLIVEGMTVSAAVANFDPSMTLVATTLHGPLGTTPGAEYSPPALTRPQPAPCTVHVTAWFADGGLTVARNCCVELTGGEAIAGETATEIIARSAI